MVVNYEFILRLFIAAVLGALIGVERSFAHKSAGLRTYALVALGSALFTLTSRFGFEGVVGFATPDRIASNVVVGVGFIGAGLIIFHKNKLQGLTTAAGIWLSAALGMASALGLYFLSFVTAFLAIIILYSLRPIEDKIRGRGGEDEKENQD